jgi:uncharacterized membrane protein
MGRVDLVGIGRASGEVVSPTLSDPVARLASTAVGGPLGRHARTGQGWWVPLRVVLAVATIVFGLGVVQKSACVVENWSDVAFPKAFSHLCYTDIPYVYVNRGLAEKMVPYEPLSSLPVDKQPLTVKAEDELTIEYPVLTGAWMGVASVVTHALGRSPDLSRVSHASVGSNLDVQYDSAVFWSVNAVGFFLVLLIGLTLLVGAQPRRPWDALAVAASPTLALAATINWDLVAFGLVAAMFWAWSTRRPVLTGVFIGLGAATKLYQLFLLGPILALCLRERRLDAARKTTVAAAVAWLIVDLPVYIWSPHAFLWFWKFNASRGPDYGSLWLVWANRTGHFASAHTINLTTWVVFGAACLAIAALGLLAPRRPRLPQLMLLVIVAFLVVNKVYSPQYVLWLLPLAALARPCWRDLLIWQACEVFYFFAVWMHIANFFVDPGVYDWPYGLAVMIRIGGELYLVALVIRDILRPWQDPVRADGLSDDPLGGIFDTGIDSAGFDTSPPIPERPEIAPREARNRPSRGQESPLERSRIARQLVTTRSNLVVVWRTRTSISSPAAGNVAPAGTKTMLTCMCGGSTNQR